MSKRSSSSKPKGAVRAKSGCYTCRIRRKKCDENPDAEGSCQTCVRLRLQCLGFGAKRPDWMREGNSVVELRGRIKGFLAQNGMIKGHSAAAVTAAGSSHAQPVSPSALSHASSSSSSSPSSSGTPTLHGQPHPNASAINSTFSPLLPHHAGGHPSDPTSPHTLSPHMLPAPRLDYAPTTHSGSGVLLLSTGHPHPSSRTHVHSHGQAGARAPNVPGRTHSRSPTNHYAGVNGNGNADANGGYRGQPGGGSGVGGGVAGGSGGDAGYSTAGLGLNIGGPLELEQHMDTLGGDAIHGHPSTRRSHSPSSSPHGTVDLLGSTNTIPITSAPYTYTSATALATSFKSTAASASLSSTSASMSPYSSSSASPPLHPHIASPVSYVPPPTDMDWMSDVDADLLSPRSDLLDLQFNNAAHPAVNGNGLHWNGLGLGVLSGSGSGSALHPTRDRVHVAGIDVDYDTDDAVYPHMRGRPNVMLAARSGDDDDDCAALPSFTTTNYVANPFHFSTGALPSAVGPHHVHSPYHPAPMLAPDSPTPLRDGVLSSEAMLGGNYSSGVHAQHLGAHQVHHGHGNGNMHEHAPAAHHGGHTSYPLHTVQGHGGHPHASTSYDNQSRSNKLGLAPLPQAPPHQQQQGQGQRAIQKSTAQQQGPEQGQLIPYAYGVSTLPVYDSEGLQYSMKPPTTYSSFSPLYYPDMEELDRQANQDQDQVDGPGGGAHTYAGVMPTNGMVDGGVVNYYQGYSAYDYPAQAENGHYLQSSHQFIPMPLFDANVYVDRVEDPLIAHYVLHVRPVQYFFANGRVDDLLVELARKNDALRDAMCFVANVHQQRMRDNGGSSSRRLGLQMPETLSCVPDADEIGKTYHERARSVLESCKRMGRPLTNGEAMAGLQCVSSFLFAGGVGDWDWFLGIACDWVASMLSPGSRGGRLGAEMDARTTLARMDEMSGFIVRLTMWFEVLASVTQVRPPRFLEVYREVFGGAGARIVEVDGRPADAGFAMLEVMGCDNDTFLALAEISALAAWKEEKTRCHALSSVELVRRGSQIGEQYLEMGRAESPPLRPRFSSNEGPDSLETRRRLTADIFRASARLYLHTVLSGDRPGVPEIAAGVRDTIEALRRVPTAPETLRRSVVRSVVFPICLAGCMTDDSEQQHWLQQVLESEGGAGNCSEVVKVMETVWRLRRDAPPTSGDVSWRDVLREKQLPLLLV